MEPYENKDDQPVTNTEPECTQKPVENGENGAFASSAGNEQAQNPQQPNPTGAYHGAGAGQKESPYANSPYYAYNQTNSQTHYGAQQNSGFQQETGAPQPEKAKKPRKKMTTRTKHVIAAVLAVVLVAGSCGATAAAVNYYWQREQSRVYDDFNTKIAQLEQELKRVGSVTGSSSVSGSPVAAEGAMTPSQVYAKNVNSVVAISNQTTTNVWGQVTEMASSGSGFILTEDGYIISNYHVVEGATQLTVMTYLGDEYPAELIGYDAMNDVSLLKIDAKNLPPVTIGSSEDLIVGDQVVAIGNPLGELTSSLTVGYISAKDRTINTDGSLINMMQTDAAINPGNSGGPLFNMKGEVVGITTAKFSGSTSSGASIEGIGFAIPIDDVMNMMGDLKEYGYLKNQAYLGVTVMDMDPRTASMYSLPTGSYVQTVVEGGCAQKAGLQPKDIIVAVGDYEVDSNAALTSALRKFSAGQTTTLTVFRAGQELKLDITFDEKPETVTAEPTETPQQPTQPAPPQSQNPSGMNPFDFFFGGRP